MAKVVHYKRGMELFGGDIINGLEIVRQAENRYGRRYYTFKCRCGKEFTTRLSSVVNLETTSCGCYSESVKHKRNFKHGKSKSRLYNIWANMINRTSNQKRNDSDRYYMRGISVCDSWMKFVDFEIWALSNGYSCDLTIDRINPDKNYEPSNCRWVSKSVQSRNTARLRKDNTTGFRGVVKVKNKELFTASIMVNKKSIHLGCYITAYDAGMAYDKYVKENNLEHTTNGLIV